MLNLFLPSEIILDILDLLAHPRPQRHHSDALRNCALVCRAWSLPAQKRLFRNVHLEAVPGVPAKPLIRRFHALLLSITSPHRNAQALAHSVRDVTLLEVPTFGDPSRYPVLRVNPSDFARFIAACPNLQSLHLKSGLLNFDKHSFHLLTPSQSVNNAPFPKLTHISIVQERAAHTPRIEAILRNNIFPSVQSLSWTSFEGIDAHAYASALDPTTTIDPVASQHSGLPPLSISLTTLTLDFRNTGPSLGLLSTLLHSSHSSLRQLSIPHLPSSIPVHPSNASLADVLKPFGPSLRVLSLGRPACDVTNAPPIAPPAQIQLPAPTDEDSDSVTSLNLRDLTPNLETLECLSYPFEPLILGWAHRLRAHRRADGEHELIRTRTSHLPPALKKLEIRLRHKLHPSLWTNVVQAIQCAVVGGGGDDDDDDNGDGRSLQCVRLELPQCLVSALSSQNDFADFKHEARVVPGDCRNFRQGAEGFPKEIKALQDACTERGIALELVCVE